MKRSLILSLSAIALCALLLVPVLAGEDRAPAATPTIVTPADAAARDLHRAATIEIPLDGRTFVFRAEATFVIRARAEDGLVCIREVRDPTVTPVKVPRGYTVTPVPGERSFGFQDDGPYRMTETFRVTKGDATLYTAPSAEFRFDRTDREIHPISLDDRWGVR